MVNRQVTGMHTLFPLLPPKHNKVSDDPGLYLVTLAKCLGELGVNCPRVSLPELEEMGTERVLLVNWGLPSDLVTPSNTFLLFGGEERRDTECCRHARLNVCVWLVFSRLWKSELLPPSLPMFWTRRSSNNGGKSEDSYSLMSVLVVDGGLACLVPCNVLARVTQTSAALLT